MNRNRLSFRIAFLTLLLTASPLFTRAANATWSIIVVDTATGEVGVAQATCIVGPNLQRSLAVVVPGVGGACVQAWWDFDGRRRAVIWDGFQRGLTPDSILDELEALGSWGRFQFGIATLGGDRGATHTGTGNGSWAGGLSGRAGTLSFAIQGNVLAGEKVVEAARTALLSTRGDLAEKLMAGMLAAAEMGGDGRCSCDQGGPDDCGTPPPGFDLDSGKSAHVGFLLVSRVGDAPGGCDARRGCATGDYYLNLEVTPGQNGQPDPIVEMHEQFQLWRESLVGRPDAIETHRELVSHPRDDRRKIPALPAGKRSSFALQLELADYRDVPLSQGGAKVQVFHDPSSSGIATIGQPIDHGDGTYTIPMNAGDGKGRDVFQVVVDDGLGEIVLYPFPELPYR